MVNIECQSSSFLFDNPSSSLPKMRSTVDLYNYLTNDVSFKLLYNSTDNDDDLLNLTSPTAMTNSDSSDSAIVTDDLDDIDLNPDENSIAHYSWPTARKKPNEPISKTFTSLSQSFDILNDLKSPNISENITHDNNQEKYKRPLPWLNSTLSNHNHSVSPLELPTNKVFF